MLVTRAHTYAYVLGRFFFIYFVVSLRWRVLNLHYEADGFSPQCVRELLIADTAGMLENLFKINSLHKKIKFPAHFQNLLRFKTKIRQPITQLDQQVYDFMKEHTKQAI